MAEIGQGALNSTIAPASILLCHSTHQRDDLGSGSRSSRPTVRASIIFLSDQSSMPGQQGLRSHYSGDFIENPPADFLRLCCQPATLVIVETQSAIADLLSQHPIFFHHVRDDMLLVLVHPSGEGDHEKDP